MKTENKKEIRITRVFDAPRELVWRMWVEPDMIKKWWGPENFTSPTIKVDLREGGKYLYCMRGSVEPNQPVKDYWSGGTFKEIVPMEKIILTDSFTNEKGEIVEPADYDMPKNFPRESDVTITFEKIEDKTLLTILYKPESEAQYDAMVDTKMDEGWQSSLDKLAKNLK